MLQGYGTTDSCFSPLPRGVEALKGKQLTSVAAAKHHTGDIPVHQMCHACRCVCACAAVHYDLG